MGAETAVWSQPAWMCLAKLSEMAVWLVRLSKVRRQIVPDLRSSCNECSIAKIEYLTLVWKSQSCMPRDREITSIQCYCATPAALATSPLSSPDDIKEYFCLCIKKPKKTPSDGKHKPYMVSKRNFQSTFTKVNFTEVVLLDNSIRITSTTDLWRSMHLLYVRHRAVNCRETRN